MRARGWGRVIDVVNMRARGCGRAVDVVTRVPRVLGPSGMGVVLISLRVVWMGREVARPRPRSILVGLGGVYQRGRNRGRLVCVRSETPRRYSVNGRANDAGARTSWARRRGRAHCPAAVSANSSRPVPSGRRGCTGWASASPGAASSTETSWARPTERPLARWLVGRRAGEQRAEVGIGKVSRT
jgi:hypothetical protein